jgi:transcriptional regulator with XRE-family HTH domain
MMTTLRNFIGERIRAIRQAKGLTQQKLADLSGLDYRYIGALERGERNFSVDTLEKVLTALKISFRELTLIDNKEGTNQTRQVTVDQFIALTEGLTDEQMMILLRVSQEIRRGFIKGH